MLQYKNDSNKLLKPLTMRDSKSRILRYVLLGLSITAVMVLIKIGVEHTTAGHRAELFAFEFLQGQLSPFDTTTQSPVVVVDISDIRESKNGEVIDLARLGTLVMAIAEERPRAIAIDAIITPERDDENQKAEEDDRQKKLEENYFGFLDLCLQKIRQEKGIPVFIGVGERTVDLPTEWLGGDKYRDLAATLIIPKNETQRIPIWFKAHPESDKLFSLSASLAKAFRRVHLPAGFTWVVNSVDEEFPGTQKHLKENMEYADALVNYSKLEAIQESKLFTISEASVRESREKFRDRMVILGDGTKEKAVDTFVVAGRQEAVPGVYLHAAAAYTFAKEPMYEFKFWVRLALDLLLSLSIIALVVVSRYRRRNDRKIFDWHRLQNRLVLGFLVGVGLLAVLLVRYTGVLWLDFLLVMLALWLHPKVEKVLLR